MKTERVYETLLRLYPVDFRARFAAEMIATFEEATAQFREQGQRRSVQFALGELLGLLIGAMKEWMAKLSTDAWVRGRCLPDLRMMRPPGVTRELWFAVTRSTTDDQCPAKMPSLE